MATSVLMKGTAEKAAGDSVRIACDFGNADEILGGATISSFNVTCSGTGAPTVTAKQKDYPYQISAMVIGGDAGSYDLVFSVTLDDADATVIERTGVLKIL